MPFFFFLPPFFFAIDSLTSFVLPPDGSLDRYFAPFFPFLALRFFAMECAHPLS